MARYPARIHVLLARQAAVGLVLRRGPSKQVAAILWDRHRDEFRLGQWLKGRIYERRSDLSPDGKYFIYFAVNGRWKSETRGAWTAISKAPYLKALALFAKGDCWHGGGLWTGKRQYWLNDGYGHTVIRDTKDVHRDVSFKLPECYGSECSSVYYPRLLRDGWKLVKRVTIAKWKSKDIFEKSISKGWILRKIAHAETGPHPEGKGCYWDEHELVRPSSEAIISCPKWEWAEIDKKRLVWATGGKLYCGQMMENGLANETELHDFNEMTFEAIKY